MREIRWRGLGNATGENETGRIHVENRVGRGTGQSAGLLRAQGALSGGHTAVMTRYTSDQYTDRWAHSQTKLCWGNVVKQADLKFAVKINIAI